MNVFFQIPCESLLGKGSSNQSVKRIKQGLDRVVRIGRRLIWLWGCARELGVRSGGEGGHQQFRSPRSGRQEIRRLAVDWCAISAAERPRKKKDKHQEMTKRNVWAFSLVWLENRSLAILHFTRDNDLIFSFASHCFA